MLGAPSAGQRSIRPYNATPSMAKQRNLPLDYAVYLICRCIDMVFHCLPIELDLRIARALGSLLYYVDKKHRHRGISNVHRSFPHFTDRQCRALARESLRQTVMLAVEMLFTTNLVRIDTFDRHIKFENFTEVLELLIRRETGLIMLTGHYGNWEVLGYVLATLGFETTSIARPLDNPYVNQWILGVRERQGQKIVSKKGATDEVIPVIEAKGAIGFIADQNAGSKGVFVDFFGRKASTYKSIALLAMEYQVPIVVGYARRSRQAFHFHVGVADIIYPAHWADQPDPLRYITQRYTKALEDVVRQDPAQYLWVHRRWKTRPKNEAPEQYD